MCFVKEFIYSCHLISLQLMSSSTSVVFVFNTSLIIVAPGTPRSFSMNFCMNITGYFVFLL